MSKNGFNPTHKIKKGTEYSFIDHGNMIARCIETQDRDVVVLYERDMMSLVETQYSMPMLIRTSDLLEIEEEPEVPVIEGFELCLVTIDEDDGHLYCKINGATEAVIEVIHHKTFAGFVYDTYDTFIRSESRLFVTEVDSNSRTFSSSTLGDHSYMILPKWVAFVK